MIFDIINNSNQYLKLHKYFEKAFDFIKQYEKKHLPNGVYKINGEHIFAIVDSYFTKEKKTQNSEAHRKYIDIQYIHSGEEKIGYNNINDMHSFDEYSAKKDIIFYKGNPGNWIYIKNKEFAIFYPEDAHMPCIKSGIQSCEVKKIVVKIEV